MVEEPALTESLHRLWRALAPEVLALLKSGENFKIEINATKQGGEYVIRTEKTIRVK